MKNKLVIKQAEPQDANYLSQLALRSKGHWGYDKVFLERCRDELTYAPQQLRSLRYYFAKAVHPVSKKIVGFYALAYEPPNTVELEALFIEPDYIGQGLGRVLINSAIKIATEQGYTCMVIYGDPNAETFYLKQGAIWVANKPSQSIAGRLLPVFHLSLK